MMFRGYSLDGQSHLLSVVSSPAHLCSVMKNNRRNIRVIFYYHGAPAARRAAKRSTILIKENKGNPYLDISWFSFSIARRRPRVGTTTNAVDRDMQPCWASLIWTSVLRSIDTRQNKDPLTKITWTSWGLTFRAHQCHVLFEVDPCSIRLRAHASLTCSESRFVRKLVNASQNVNRSINFLV